MDAMTLPLLPSFAQNERKSRPSSSAASEYPHNSRIARFTYVSRPSRSAMAIPLIDESMAALRRESVFRERLRSVMSVMLPRTITRPSYGIVTKRTSHAMSAPAPVRCVHSNTGVAPARTRVMYSRPASSLERPSGCVGGLTSAIPRASSASRDSPNSRSALLLASAKWFCSTSNTTIASGACSICTRYRRSLSFSASRASCCSVLSVMNPCHSVLPSLRRSGRASPRNQRRPFCGNTTR